METCRGVGEVDHKFCNVTFHCVKCGVSEWDVVEGLRDRCDEVGNVTAVSHIIAVRRMIGEHSTNVVDIRPLIYRGSNGA